MRTMVLALAALLFSFAASAQTGGGELAADARRIAAMVAGQQVGEGNEPADKVLSIGRDPARGTIITGIQVLAPGASNDGIQITDRAIAVLRTRAATPNGNRAPDPDDIAYVRRTGMRLFIVGEWSTPPAIWEIERDNGSVRLRAIDPEGRLGPRQAAGG